jgi:hypothetical protein
MTPTAQRIAIAEACGWKWFTVPFNSEQDVLARDEEHAKTILLGQWVWSLTPDYLSDLNAMHEAEKVLDDEQRKVFAWHMMCGKFDWYKEEPEMRELGPNPRIGWLEESPGDAFKTYHATAAQRAEAFLRTIGKWREG